jgi:hypothetical protein
VAQRVLAAQEASGETVTAFARRQGLQVQRLQWWRSRLEEWERRAAPVESSLVPAVIQGVEQPAVKVRVGEVQVEIGDASAVSPAWVAELVRALGSRN